MNRSIIKIGSCEDGMEEMAKILQLKLPLFEINENEYLITCLQLRCLNYYLRKGIKNNIVLLVEIDKNQKLNKYFIEHQNQYSECCTGYYFFINDSQIIDKLELKYPNNNFKKSIFGYRFTKVNKNEEDEQIDENQIIINIEI